jgi:hypothetical protein
MKNFQQQVKGMCALLIAAVLFFSYEVCMAQTMNGDHLVINGGSYVLGGVGTVCPLQPSGNELASCVKIQKEALFFNACKSFIEKKKQCVFGVLPINPSKEFRITSAVIEKALSIEKIDFSNPYRLIDTSDVTCTVKGSAESFVVALGVFEDAPRRDGFTYTKVISRSWVMDKSFKFTEVPATDVNCFYPDRD